MKEQPCPARIKIERFIDRQLQLGSPPETKQTLQRLLSLGYSEQDARNMIVHVLATEYYRASVLGQPFTPQDFVRDLRQLPTLPWEVAEDITEEDVTREILENTELSLMTEAETRTRYQQLRKRVTLVSEAMLESVLQDDFSNSAKTLGLLHHGVLTAGSENDLFVAADHAIYANPRKRRHHIDAYRRTHPKIDDDTESVLEAIEEAEFCVLQFEERVPPLGVRVNDLLRHRSFILVDLSLAQTAPEKMLFATHVLAPEGIYMTTGAGMPIADAEVIRSVYDIVKRAISNDRRSFDDFNSKGELTTRIMRMLLESGAAERMGYVEPGKPAVLPTAQAHAPGRLALYPDDQAATPVRAHGVGRNAPCPCGSGKKYKQCCAAREKSA